MIDTCDVIQSERGQGERMAIQNHIIESHNSDQREQRVYAFMAEFRRIGAAHTVLAGLRSAYSVSAKANNFTRKAAGISSLSLRRQPESHDDGPPSQILFLLQFHYSTC